MSHKGWEVSSDGFISLAKFSFSSFSTLFGIGIGVEGEILEVGIVLKKIFKSELKHI